MSIQHLPYPKIRTSLAGKLAAKGEWVASEKIHGANMVIACDGKQVCFGKRKAWLEDDSPFFGWQLLRERLRRAILTIHPH